MLYASGDCFGLKPKRNRKAPGMIVVREFSQPHDVRGEERLTQCDGLLDAHQSEGRPALEFRLTSVFLRILNHRAILPARDREGDIDAPLAL